jgi:transposase
MAITSKETINYTCYTENVNSDIFFEFIKNTIKKLQEKEYTFMFDNVSFHKNKDMLNYIIENGHNYINTPPYSPNNNPIENVFSVIKNKFKKLSSSIKKKTDNIIMSKITDAVVQFNNEYSDRLIKYFNRAINYDYSNIEKELRDRIVFSNIKNA